jgi:hypothetical protein
MHDMIDDTSPGIRGLARPQNALWTSLADDQCGDLSGLCRAITSEPKVKKILQTRDFFIFILF